MMIRIGIDPDCQASGVAIMHDGKLVELKKLKFFDLMAFIELNKNDLVEFNRNAIYSVEDVSFLKPTFQRFRKDGFTKLTKAEMEKISQNVGRVKNLGQLIAEKLEICKCKYELIIPLKGTIKRAKTDKKFFNALMHWTGQSHADTRDAALLLHRYLKDN